jgi:DNA-binding NarL/FixJ family response regulator
MAQTETTTRFWNKVQKAGPDECWLWTAATLPKGYGVFSRDGRQVLAHRFSCELALGRPIDRADYVLHSCDNPRCVNPAHLRVGSQADNVKDTWDRRRRKARDVSGVNSPWVTHPHRMRRGEGVNTAVLTEASVREAWRLILSGHSATETARLLHAPIGSIRAIMQGRSWRHLHDAPSVDALRSGGKRQAPKLTDADKSEILRMLAQGWTVAAVAAHFNVSTAPVSNLKNYGTTWRPKPT